MKHFGLQSRDDVGEVRGVQNAIEETTLIWFVRPGQAVVPPARINGLLHGSAMIPASTRDKQS
jgi:hypothetical protein